MGGFIKDFRSELKSDIWMMPPLYHRVWQYLKYKVNHSPNKIPMEDGSFFDIEPGQHLTSVRNIAKGIGYYEGLQWKEPNPRTISKILEWLEKQEMITINRGRGNRQYTLVTLSNWDSYQSKDGGGNSKTTASTSGSKQPVHIKKNDKECLKNEKEKEDDKAPVEINPFQFYEQEGFGTLSSFIGQQLGDLIDDFGEEDVMAAMKETRMNGSNSLNYTKKILTSPKLISVGGANNGTAKRSDPKNDERQSAISEANERRKRIAGI
ncbi:DnaD domain protein [Sporosarcina sp. FSL K6-5500]|uniref:DnaD domain protein n=1 Tax=Sporosarcina sp. FSL K6-5500 TaxID=2921558 RepID=UPI0030FC660F